MNHENNEFQKKLQSTLIGSLIECDANEAILAGAFIEDALTEEDAMESQIDLPGENHE